MWSMSVYVWSYKWVCVCWCVCMCVRVCVFDPLVGREMQGRAKALAQVSGCAPDWEAIPAPLRSSWSLCSVTISGLSFHFSPRVPAWVWEAMRLRQGNTCPLKAPSVPCALRLPLVLTQLSEFC